MYLCYWPDGVQFGVLFAALAALAAFAVSRACECPRPALVLPERHRQEKPEKPTRFRRGLVALGAAVLLLAAVALTSDRETQASYALVEAPPASKAERAACRCATPGCLARTLRRRGPRFKPPHFWRGAVSGNARDLGASGRSECLPGRHRLQKTTSDAILRTLPMQF